MSDAVLLLAPDGTYGSEVAFSTTQPQRFFTGTVPDDTVDVEVAVDGGPWTADPALVHWAGGQFTVPAPAASSEGFPLHSGENTLAVRAVLLSGGVSAAATARVTVRAPASWDAYPPPSPLTVERRDGAVTLTVEHVGDASPTPTGYHFYASTAPGGGESGYVRVTLSPVTTFTLNEERTDLVTLTERASVSDPAPNYFRARLTREDEEGVLRAVDADDRVVLPEDASEFETTLTLARVRTRWRCSFEHRRDADPTSVPPTVFVGAFAARPPGDPLYYVATAVYWDGEAGAEFESYYSLEVAAAPVGVRTALMSLPAVSRSQVLEEAIFAVHRTAPEAAVQPGAAVRDTMLDPLAAEAERLRFVLDFLYRASSFDLLLAIDDPEGTGESVAPTASAYKTALAGAFFLANVADVQPVIDAAFEKLAANFGRPRASGRRARGEVRFYTAVRPTRTLTLPLGALVNAGAIQFRTIRSAELPVDRLASYYDPVARTYSITVPVEAVDVGGAGNVGPRQITGTAAYGFSVINDAATYDGADRESNAALAAAARGALAAVDTGTAEGLVGVARGVAGVVAQRVIEAGSPYMVRDYDLTTGRPRGGAVDIWTRGRRLATVRETFYFAYERRYAVQFVLTGNPANLQFRVLDSELTPDQPLAAMLDYADRNLGLRNVTTGAWFDLTGVQVLNYNTIRLDTDRFQPPVSLTDVVTGDFRLRRGVRYTPARQPVVAVYSLVGEATGTVDPAVYRLERASVPMALGRSTRAGDYLQVTAPAPGSALVAPSSAELSVTDEIHVLTGYYPEPLDRLGADPFTVEVTSLDGSVTYYGPAHPSGTPDYTVGDGTATTAASIRRTAAGRIADGETVVVSYRHAENFTLTYQVNLVTEAVQAAVSSSTHASSDVLAKEMVEVPVVITASISLKRGQRASTVDRAIRNRLSQLVSSLPPGTPLRRSDVIATLDRTPGVEYVSVPLTRLARAEGSLVAYDTLAVTTPSEAALIPSWSSSTVSTWLLEVPLAAPTLNGVASGYSAGVRCAAYENGVALELLSNDPSTLKDAPGRAYLVGGDGVSLPNRGQVRNRLVVSLPVGSSPVGRTYWATYGVADDRLEYDIIVAPVEFIVLGDFTATYTEARA